MNRVHCSGGLLSTRVSLTELAKKPMLPRKYINLLQAALRKDGTIRGFATQGRGHARARRLTARATATCFPGMLLDVTETPRHCL